MIKFFKDSFRELKHVVWPTANETKKYFAIIISVLVIF
jgi:preprotein translocase SecE subunit